MQDRKVKMLLTYFKKTIDDKELIKRCLTIAIPLMFQQLIVASVNLIDNLMVGELGDVAVSAVSCANRYYAIVQMAINAIVVSSIIFLSQYNGANDKEHMKQSFRFSIISSYLFVLLFCILALTCSKHIIRFIINDEFIIKNGSDYLKIACFSYLPLGLSFPISNAMRSTGDTKSPLFVSMCSVIMNIFFDYCLIFGHFGFKAMGVKGAAIATVIVRFIEMFVYLFFLVKGNYQFKTKLNAFFDIDKDLIYRIIIKAFPLLINEILWNFGMATIIKCYSKRGSIVNTAYSISSTVADLFFILFAGMASATTVIVGTKLGADKIEEAKDSAYKLLCFSLMMSLVIALLMSSFTLVLPSLYSKVSKEALNLANHFLKVMAIFFILYMFNTQCYFILRTGGDTKNTMFMDSGFMWAFNIPLVYLIAYHTSIPVLYVYCIGQSTDILKAIIAYKMIRKEKWAKNLTINDACYNKKQETI